MTAKRWNEIEAEMNNRAQNVWADYHHKKEAKEIVTKHVNHVLVGLALVGVAVASELSLINWLFASYWNGMDALANFTLLSATCAIVFICGLRVWSERSE